MSLPAKVSRIRLGLDWVDDHNLEKVSYTVCSRSETFQNMPNKNDSIKTICVAYLSLSVEYQASCSRKFSWLQ